MMKRKGVRANYITYRNRKFYSNHERQLRPNLKFGTATKSRYMRNVPIQPMKRWKLACALANDLPNEKIGVLPLPALCSWFA
eukprot:scaffold4635_cov267-Pinguiococcus_pyrenoidosus.AAC.12